MKLIEILLQRLPAIGGWPEGYDTISTNSGGRLWAYRHTGGVSGKDLNIFTMLDGTVTRDEYEAALAASKEMLVKKPVAWDGKGLPPVGLDICVTPHNNNWGFSRVGDFCGKVLAYDGEDFWFKLTNGGKVASRTDKVDFKPIRSKEEEKRVSAIDSLVEFKINYHSHPKAAEEYLREMSSLYDAIAAGNITGVKLEAPDA